MSAAAVAAAIAIALSLGQAVVAVVRAIRRDAEQDGAAPFLTGRSVIEEAEAALRLKDRRMADQTLELEQARAKSSAQQGQIQELYLQIGTLHARDAEKTEQLRRAAKREELDRQRIESLERQIAELRKTVGLGIDPGAPAT